MTFADSEQKSSLTFFFIDFRDPFYVKAGGNSTALDHKSHGIQTPPCASGWCLKVIEVSKHFIIIFCLIYYFDIYCRMTLKKIMELRQNGIACRDLQTMVKSVVLRMFYGIGSECLFASVRGTFVIQLTG